MGIITAQKIKEYALGEVEIRPYKFFGLFRINFAEAAYVPLLVLLLPLAGPLAIFFYSLSLGSINAMLFALLGIVGGRARIMFSMWTGTAIAMGLYLAWKVYVGKKTMPRFSLPVLILQAVLSAVAFYIAPPWLR
jgi:hypothetical protein